MKRLSIPFIITLFALFLSLTACQNQPASASQTEEESTDMPKSTGFPVEMLTGSYEIIGRYPDSDQVYLGTASIETSDSDPDQLIVTRTIDGKSIEGSGTMEMNSEGTTELLRITFTSEDGTGMEGTYQLQVDLDNYARLSGYVYVKDGDTVVPGIEALFSDHFRSE